MMKFIVKGEINGHEKFSKEVEAKSKKHALDQAYAIIGSKNGIKRTLITITGMEAAKE
jgi:ribosomal protein L20A (L18A)